MDNTGRGDEKWVGSVSLHVAELFKVEKKYPTDHSATLTHPRFTSACSVLELMYITAETTWMHSSETYFRRFIL